MDTAVAAECIGFVVEGTNQRTYTTTAPRSSTMREVIKGVLAKMGLSGNDSNGQRQNYRARSDRTGTYLPDSATVGDAVKEGDKIVLQPNIDAGACR